MDLSEPLKIFDVLVEYKIPFVIIGGHAVNFHGYIRTTEDADIVFERTPETEARLQKALKSVRAGWISDTIDPKTGFEKIVPISISYIRSNHLMMLSTDVGFLDVFDYIPGFPEKPVREIFKDSKKAGPYRFVSLKWLKRIKEKSGRHKDLDDLENLKE